MRMSSTAVLMTMLMKGPPAEVTVTKARRMSLKTWKTWRMACQSTFMTSLDQLNGDEEEDEEHVAACSEMEDERGVFDYGDLEEHIMGQR
jgi:hypothetical protein